jgi:uncharacterized membrane protein YgcG
MLMNFAERRASFPSGLSFAAILHAARSPSYSHKQLSYAHSSGPEIWFAGSRAAIADCHQQRGVVLKTQLLQSFERVIRCPACFASRCQRIKKGGEAAGGPVPLFWWNKFTSCHILLRLLPSRAPVNPKDVKAAEEVEGGRARGQGGGGGGGGAPGGGGGGRRGGGGA